MRKLKFFLLKLKYAIKFSLNRNISSKAFLGPKVQIFGLDNLYLGDNCTIGEQTLITVNNRTNKEIQFKIGANSYIGRYNFFSVGKEITIGDYSIFGNNCSLICSDHIFDSPLVPYAKTGNSYNKSIHIGVNCWFGHGVNVIGNVKVGHGCVIGAHTLITKDIPAFSMVVGNPFRIIKTFNFSSNQWQKEPFIEHHAFLEEENYLGYLKANFGELPIAYHSASTEIGDL